MTHGSLFSGIGGWSIACEWMGWQTLFNCEINPFGQRVLKYYWPKAKLYDDITKTDFSSWRGEIDIITNSFPCQPFSVAGKRKGTDDTRYLWEESLRAICEVQPEWCVSENVPGLLTWNGGMVFDKVQTDLEDAGYEVIPFILPACGVNAPHKRERVWFVAKSGSERCNNGSNIREKRYIQKDQGITEKNKSEREGRISRLSPSGSITSNATNTNGRRQSGKEYGQEETGFITEKSVSNNWYDFPTQSPLCSRDDGFSSKLDGITFPKWRNESIKAYGNAIVPQVAYQIFKAIEEINNLKI